MKLTRLRVLLLLLAVVALIGSVMLARRFKEQWFAIPPQGGEAFTMPALQTAHFCQKDPRWAEESIGGLGESMARVGCTVCSLAMALDHYEIRKTPKELNDYLKTNAGYNARGWLRWNSVEKLSEGKVTVEVHDRPRHVAIDEAIKARQPVLAKVYINSIIPHWVLLVGKDNTEYLMRDPLGDENAVTHLSDYQSKIYAIRIMKPKTSLL